MPEANILYAVTAVVVAGLAGWVVAVLRTAKEPWRREVPAGVSAAAATEDVDDGNVEEKAHEEKKEEKREEEEEEAKDPK